MKPCTSCRRHLRRTERVCPFCGTPCREAAAPVVAVLMLATALVGCIEEPASEEGDGSSTSTTAAVSSASSEGSGTTVAGSGSGVIDGSSSGGGTTSAVDEGTTACSADDGSAFIYGPPPECRCPDPPPHCNPSLECDLFAQDCPEGEKCTTWANDGGDEWNGTRCVPVVPDPGAPGEPCTVEGSPVSGIDTCDHGSICLGVDDETLMGTCVAFCMGTPEAPSCEEEGTVCAISNGGLLPLCRDACDPLAQDCAMGEGCYPIAGVWACASDGSNGSGYGQPCEYINACAPGHACLDASAVPPGEACDGAAGCCTEICDLTDPAGDMQCAGAPGGQICHPWFEDGRAPAGLEDVGVCTLPPP